MTSFATIGNDLYTGKRSINFVGRAKTWYAVSAVLFLLAVGGLFIRHLNLGIEFTGGSDFRVASVRNLDNYESRARTVVTEVGGVPTASVTKIGADSVRIESERFEDSKTLAVSTALAKEFGVGIEQVRSSVIGPSWGASVSTKALQALIWFLVLVAVVLALYFRTWTMSLAALVALFHDIFITVGVYALAGLEVTPASMIGFLTILGYSLYDTVVVFDKVRENTEAAVISGRMSYSQAANLAVNQTLVRSINTTVVALLPVAAILVVGITVLGPGTLLDLAVALFIGIAVGAYSSIFIATPLLAHLREREPGMKQLAKRAARHQKQVGQPVFAGAGGAVRPEDEASDELPVRSVGGEEPAEGHTLTGRPIHPWVQTGPRNQPKRLPKSKR